jgi:hypothetical protein
MAIVRVSKAPVATISQTSIIFAAFVLAYIVFIVTKGELTNYRAVLGI